MHDSQIPLTLDIAQKLIYQQFPQLQEYPILQLQTQGTVHSIFRIGDWYTARFPLINCSPTDSLSQIISEACAALEFSHYSTVVSPLPVAVGNPDTHYPLHWSIHTWVPGSVATTHSPGHSVTFAEDLVQLIQALQAADTRERTFSGTGRGGNLSDHDAWIQYCFSQSAHLLHIEFLTTLWEHYRDLPRKSPDKMVHGDLIPANILVHEDHLVGLLDVGDFAPADPALDLIVAWHLLAELPREIFRTRLSCDPLDWERGKAWAFAQSMGLIWYYIESNPAMSILGATTLQRLVGNTCSVLIKTGSPLDRLLSQK